MARQDSLTNKKASLSVISQATEEQWLSLSSARRGPRCFLPWETPGAVASLASWGRVSGSCLTSEAGGGEKQVQTLTSWECGAGERDRDRNRIGLLTDPRPPFFLAFALDRWGSFLPEVGSSRAVVSRAWAGAARAAWHACWPRLIWEVKASFTSSSPSKASGFCQTGNVWSPTNQKL